MLNGDQIRDNNLILNSEQANFKGASYDLRVEKIIDMDGEEHDFYKLPPQGMAYVIFKENVSLSQEFIGFAHVKTSITQRGIMATNIGIIDPGYSGPISTLLINFGSSFETLVKGESALRLTFHQIERNSAPKDAPLPINDLAYLNARRKDTDNLSEKFLNLHTVKDEIFKKVIKTLVGLSIIFSAASFAIGMYFQNETSNDRNVDKQYKALEVSIKSLREENELYKKQQAQMFKDLEEAQKLRDKQNGTVGKGKKNGE